MDALGDLTHAVDRAGGEVTTTLRALRDARGVARLTKAARARLAADLDAAGLRCHPPLESATLDAPLSIRRIRVPHMGHWDHVAAAAHAIPSQPGVVRPGRAAPRVPAASPSPAPPAVAARATPPSPRTGDAAPARGRPVRVAAWVAGSLVALVVAAQFAGGGDGHRPAAPAPVDVAAAATETVAAPVAPAPPAASAADRRRYRESRRLASEGRYPEAAALMARVSAVPGAERLTDAYRQRARDAARRAREVADARRRAEARRRAQEQARARAREAERRRSEAAAAAPAPRPLAGDCDPNYQGACVPRVPYDLDCPDIPATDFRSVGSDPHGLDREGDGLACES